MKFTFAAVVWIMTMAALGSWIAVLLQDDQPPYRYLKGQITPNPASPGSRVVLDLETSPSERTCPGSVIRDLYDNKTGEHLATYDPTPVAVAKQKNKNEVNKTFLLPDNLKGATEVRYEGKVCFRCNVLHTFFPEMVCTETPKIVFGIKP